VFSATVYNELECHEISLHRGRQTLHHFNGGCTLIFAHCQLTNKVKFKTFCQKVIGPRPIYHFFQSAKLLVYDLLNIFVIGCCFLSSQLRQQYCVFLQVGNYGKKNKFHMPLIKLSISILCAKITTKNIHRFHESLYITNCRLFSGHLKTCYDDRRKPKLHIANTGETTIGLHAAEHG